jgi:CarD family transcriptional regulator
MFIPTGNLKIKVSAQKAEYVGIREVYEKEKVLGIMQGITDKPIDMPENWNLRYKENLEKIKSGNLSDVVIVFRNLLYREREKGLSSAEKKMLSTSKQIIISELILTQDIDRKAEEILLSKYVG